MPLFVILSEAKEPCVGSCLLRFAQDDKRSAQDDGLLANPSDSHYL
jgi:hypothetical protein